jgi:predicted amidophosphoribosyltransferase
MESSKTESDKLRGLHRFAAPLRAALRFTLDVALPPLCPSCREPLGDGVGLCATCWSKLSLIEPPYCARLGIPFTYDPGPGLLSMEAIAAPPAYDRARAAVRYDDVARALVHRFKYGDRLDLAPMMGRWMARAGRELTAGADALVPVPLHWRRLWARRFNQSAALAGAIGAIAGVPMLPAALRRVRATPQQVGLSKTERAEMCRARSGCRPSARPRSPGGGWCWSTTCSPQWRRWTPAPAPCCGREPPMSMCWSSRGL